VAEPVLLLSVDAEQDHRETPTDAIAELPTPPQAEVAIAPLDGERRLATVVIADVKDSTPLAEKMGTEAWVEMMNSVFQIVESQIYRYGGHVHQFRGDGLVAFFGTASVHEDDPERALLAALAMQKAIRPFAARLAESQGVSLQLRIGVNTGEVIIANVGDSSQHSEETAMGETVAVAARLESASEPGTVLASQDTYRLAQPRFDWQELGEITVRGISTPIAVYRPLAARSEAQSPLGPDAYGLPSPMIGRDAEVQALQGYLADLCEGRGRIVEVTGSDGSGKSFLVAWAQARSVRESALEAGPTCRVDEEWTTLSGSPMPEVLWLRGQCRSYEQLWPYSMWLDVLRRWLGLRGGESAGQAQSLLRRQASALWAEQASENYAYLAAFLSIPLDDEASRWVKRLGAEGLRQRVFWTVRSWLREVASRGPLVLVLEDVHWADRASLDLLDYCLPLCEHLPVLWLIVYRPDRAAPVWKLHQDMAARYPDRLASLNLPALTETQTSEMIDELVGPQALPPEVRALVIGKSEGNPYYVEELIRSLIRMQALVYDAPAGRWHMRRMVDSLDMPDTLRGLLLAHIDDLSADERRVLQMAAVIGYTFYDGLLQDLVGDDTSVEPHLATLQRAQLVVERTRVPNLGMEYAFRSPLVRDVAYASILTTQRVAFHRQVADHLAQLFSEEILAQYYGMVAYHYRSAGEWKRELFYTLSAAERAQSLYAHAEALGYYSRVLELLDESVQAGAQVSDRLLLDWRVEAHKGLGQVHFGTGRMSEAENCFRQAIAVGQQMQLASNELVKLYYWLAETLFWQGRHNEQIGISARGLSLLGDEVESVEAALMNQEIAVGYSAIGDRHRFHEFTARTARFLEALPYTEELRPAYDHVASMYAYDERNVPEAKRWLGVLETKAEQYGDLRALGDVHFTTAGILQQAGELREALAQQELALGLYRRIEDGKHEQWCLNRLTEVLLSLGDLRQAEECARRSVSLGDRGGGKSGAGDAWLGLGQVLLCRSEWDDALAAFNAAMPCYHQAQNASGVMATLYCVGQTHLSRGDYEGATEVLKRLGNPLQFDAAGFDGRALSVALRFAEQVAQDADAFRVMCTTWRESHPRLTELGLAQWYLEPAGRLAPPDPEHGQLAWAGTGAVTLGPDWEWRDPSGECRFVIRDGLEIRAANGRDLHHINLTSPCLLRPAPANAVLQTVCSLASAEQPAIGGILYWRDRDTFVRLDWGSGGPHEISLRGCLGGQDVVLGRGLLPPGFARDGSLGIVSQGARNLDNSSELGQTAQPTPWAAQAVFLRMECAGGQLAAFCSKDGSVWFSVGRATLPGEGPALVGVYASGSIDRLVYPGAYPDGTAIRFGAFHLRAG
jgi:class 3 adenylate cyclase/predicted ATPase